LRNYIPVLARRSYCFLKNLETLKAVVSIFIDAYNRFGDAKFQFRQAHHTGYEACYGCVNLKIITVLNTDCEIYSDKYTLFGNATVIGYDNSTAYNYAVRYKLKFIDIETNEILIDSYEEIGEWNDNIDHTLKDGILTLFGNGEMSSRGGELVSMLFLTLKI
jgi:hypothetical protein